MGTTEKELSPRPGCLSVAKTGWDFEQTVRAAIDPCHGCGDALSDCQGCDEPRCLTCDPYLSDDCRWTI